MTTTSVDYRTSPALKRWHEENADPLWALDRMLSGHNGDHRVGPSGTGVSGVWQPWTIPTDRQLYLWAWACRRLVWPVIGPKTRALITYSYEWLDVLCDWDKVMRGADEAGVVEIMGVTALGTPHSPPPQARDIVRQVLQAGDSRGFVPDHCKLMRCVIASPHPDEALEMTRVSLDWLTQDVRALADECYGPLPLQEGWDAVVILADALEDAGCDNDRLLAHLRSWPTCSQMCPTCDGLGYVFCTDPAGDSDTDTCPTCEGQRSVPFGHPRGCWAVEAVRAAGRRP